jgi:predicted ABC-type ATPase
MVQGKLLLRLNTYQNLRIVLQQFINADLIAAGLSPLAPERELVAASRILFEMK